ncbi:phosphate/phosphite/phosphonate ABC transporter substrate-binding protein [Candidatus Dependentiae bacterium]|nr:phosphate/phosphite/phosphonate ABC transporter substrate-binding protein [Candidatus Dependentiae bacterium]
MFKSNFIKKIFIFVFLINIILCSQLYAKDKYTFAMLPQITQNKVYASWKPVIEFLQKETGLTFDFIYPKNFEEHTKLCSEGKIDFAYSNPITYIQFAAKKERPKGHIVIAEAQSKNGFFGEFITRKDNDSIKSIKDIKGKKGWITGWDSAGGYVFQQAHSLDNGIDMKKDCEIKESPENKQEKVIMAVISKTADFGCIRNGMRQKSMDIPGINDLKVLAETSKYPEWLFSSNSQIPKDIAEKVQNALTKLPEDILKQAALPGNIIKFTKKTDKDLDVIRKVADKTGIKY